MKRGLKLRRNWFEFSGPESSRWPRIRCGVDALNLIRERVVVGADVPEIARVVEDIDVSTLDANHVLPNMGLVTVRGIWFPWPRSRQERQTCPLPATTTVRHHKWGLERGRTEMARCRKNFAVTEVHRRMFLTKFQRCSNCMVCPNCGSGDGF